MTHITIERAKLKLALDALKKNHYYMIEAGLPNQSMLNANFDAFTALTQALAAQPAPVPLTDEQLLEILVGIDSETKRLPFGFKDFARAIESPHGITKGQP
jgi:hypothetical protein